MLKTWFALFMLWLVTRPILWVAIALVAYAYLVVNNQ